MTFEEYLSSLKGKTVGVIGVGVSNRPLIEKLLERGIDVTARDKKEDLGELGQALTAQGCKLRLGSGYLADLHEDVIFRTPGLRPDVPELAAAVAGGSVITSEMEAFFAVCPCPILAVTGSDGKTTTTTIISKLLAALSRAAGDKAEEPDTPVPEKVSTVDTVPGWTGEPPYRYLDVSRYQGKITLDGWRKVKAAGYKGVMLKTVSTNKKLSKRADGLYIDPTFETNYRNAKAAGLDVGVYYYTYATSEAMADAELALVRQAVYGKELTMPLAVDVEENKLKPMSTLDLTNLTAYALEQVEKMGFYAQLYTYTGYSYELDMGRLANRWDVWLADYTGKTPAVGYHYNAHQHTSKGRVPGISGNVDLNVTTRNYPRIIRKKGLTRLREGA